MGAVSSVPEHFADRMYYIQHILNTGSNKQFNKAEVQFHTSLLSPSLVLGMFLPCHQAYLPMLQKVSDATSTIYTAFVSPPVSTCLMETCQGAALSRPHPPIVVTIFTLINGPLPALKCKYVEVSDVVYCERQYYIPCTVHWGELLYNNCTFTPVFIPTIACTVGYHFGGLPRFTSSTAEK